MPIPAILADIQLCSSGGREAQPLAFSQLSPQRCGQSAERSFNSTTIQASNTSPTGTAHCELAPGAPGCDCILPLGPEPEPYRPHT